jgi:multisubunit Na+/H+ antiporter MnhB subunit
MIISMKNRGLATRIRWLEHYSVNRKKYRKALKILISVVIGALLLAGLYMLFNDTVLPTLVERVKELFNYRG